jgi:hypothetical protein
MKTLKEEKNAVSRFVRRFAVDLCCGQLPGYLGSDAELLPLPGSAVARQNHTDLGFKT